MSSNQASLRPLGKSSFHAARKRADNGLAKTRRTVVGTAIGMKVTGGVVDPSQVCLTVFVTTKKPKSRLRRDEMIPASVTRFSTEIPTDVIEIRQPPRLEFGFAINDSTQLGTSGCFARNADGVYAVSCAHCVSGPDRDPTSSDPIFIEFPMREMYLYAGNSVPTVPISGGGTFPAFGDSDVGLIAISPEAKELQQYAMGRDPLSLVEWDGNLTMAQVSNMLRYTPVQGWGAGSDNIVRGRVARIFVQLYSRYYDLMIESYSNSGLTRPGDSGLMWLNAANMAVGMHMAGADFTVEGSSRYSLSMFASRIPGQLQAQLLMP